MNKSKTFKGHRCEPCITHHRPCDGVRPVCGSCHFRKAISNEEECHWRHDRAPPARLRRTAKGPRRDHPRPSESSPDNDEPTASNEELSGDEEKEVASAPLSNAESGSTVRLRLRLPPSRSSAQQDQRTLRHQAPEAPPSTGQDNTSPVRSLICRTPAMHIHGQQGTTDGQPNLNTNQGPAHRNATGLTVGTRMGWMDTQPAYSRQSQPFRSTITPVSVRSGDLPAEGIAIPNVDRGLDEYVNQLTSHLTVDPNDPRWHFRQSRVVVVSEGQGQITWEYPYRPGRPTFPMMPDEAAPFLFSADGQPLLGNMPTADHEIFHQRSQGNVVDNQTQPNNPTRLTMVAGETGEPQQSMDRDGKAGTVADDAEDDSWMERFVDLDGIAN